MLPPIEKKEVSDDLRNALIALSEIAEGTVSLWSSSSEISAYLYKTDSLHLHWRTIDKLFANSRAYVERRRRKSSWQYRLLRDGKRIATRDKGQSILVDPSKPVQAVIDLHGLLKSLKPPVKLCDPYFDSSSLEHLQACPAGEIRVLTDIIKESGYLRRLYAAARRSYSSFEIRAVAQHVLHDRYIIDQNRMLVLGTSLNGFGKKQSFIIEVGIDIRTIIESYFDDMWKKALPWT